MERTREWLETREGEGVSEKELGWILAATFREEPGFSGMKTFLKVLLIVVAVVIAVKLLPIAFVIGCAVAALLAGLAVLGVSLAALLICAALAVAALLSPIWVPILAIVGIVALCRRHGNGAATTV